jgi:hypothetical protein
MLSLKAYEHGAGYLSLPPLLFFAWLTGLGGSAAFSGAIKAGKFLYQGHHCHDSN